MNYTDGPIRDARKLGIKGLSLGALGTQLMSDYNSKNEILRTETLSIERELMEEIQQSGISVMADGCALPLVANVDFVSGIPLSASSYKIEKAGVPFLQIALHGFLSQRGPLIELFTKIHQGFHPH